MVQMALGHIITVTISIVFSLIFLLSANLAWLIVYTGCRAKIGYKHKNGLKMRYN